MKLKFLLLGVILSVSSTYAQDYFPKNDGVKTENTNYTVFKNAKIHVNPETTIQNAMLAIRNGKITAVGKNITIPKNSIIIDLEGKEVYPSFIDLYSSFGIDKPNRVQSGNGPQYDANREGFYWNDHIRPETNAVAQFKYNESEADKLLEAGFGAVNTHVPDGIVRGTGMLVALTPAVSEGDRILNDRSSQFLSFDKSALSAQSYPTSLMGATSLLANWI